MEIHRRQWLRSVARTLFAMLAIAIGPALFDVNWLASRFAQAQEADQPTELEKNVDDLLNEFSAEFDQAIASLERTNTALDDALAQRDIEGALAKVNSLLDKINNLADKLRPGNATEARVESLLTLTDHFIEILEDDEGLSPDDKDVRLRA